MSIAANPVDRPHSLIRKPGVHDVHRSPKRATSRSDGQIPRSVRHRTMLVVPLMREGESIGVIMLSPNGGAPLHRQADRVAANLRRPGRDRHRERAAVRRGAGKTRDLTEALEQQTATSEVLSVISSSPGDLRPGVPENARERATRLRREFRRSVPARTARSSINGGGHNMPGVSTDRFGSNAHRPSGNCGADGDA